MSNNIEGKVVIITGASSGLGKSTARHLASKGAVLVLGAWTAFRLLWGTFINDWFWPIPTICSRTLLPTQVIKSVAEREPSALAHYNRVLLETGNHLPCKMIERVSQFPIAANNATLEKKRKIPIWVKKLK